MSSGQSETPWASFADALSGMLFVFLITTFIFAMRLQEAEERLKEAEKQAKSKADEAGLLIAKLSKFKEQENLRFRDLSNCLSDRQHSSKLSVTSNIINSAESRLSLHLTDLTWFPPDKSTFTDPSQAKEAIDQVASCLLRLMKDNEQDDYQLRVYVEGHTDGKQMRSNTNGRSNWELSGERAAAFVKELRGCTAEHCQELRDALHKDEFELMAVAWESQKPAIGHLCKQEQDPQDKVCNALERDADTFDQALEEQLRDMIKNKAEFALPGECKPVDDLPDQRSEKLRLWSHYCEPGKPDQRLGYHRRIDLRIELLPKRQTSTAYPKAQE